MRQGKAILLAVGLLAIGLYLYTSSEPDLTPARSGNVDEVAVDLIDLDGLLKEVESNKGSVLLVDFWATWCGPCRRDFPKLVGLHERYLDRGLKCISVALEQDPASDRAETLSFLKHEHAAFTNFVFSERTTRGGDGLEEHFGYPGMIPYAALFAKDGKRVLPPDKRMFSKRELIEAIEVELTR